MAKLLGKHVKKHGQLRCVGHGRSAPMKLEVIAFSGTVLETVCCSAPDGVPWNFYVAYMYHYYEPLPDSAEVVVTTEIQNGNVKSAGTGSTWKHVFRNLRPVLDSENTGCDLNCGVMPLETVNRGRADSLGVTVQLPVTSFSPAGTLSMRCDIQT